MEKEIFKIYKETTHKRWGHRVYEVSDLGRVKLNGEIVEPKLHSSGYLACAHFFIHRAVAELFVPNPENKPVIDHINTDRLDNRAENLRWVTTKENCNNPLTRRHYSESKRGRVITAEWKRKISETRKGKLMSEETKRKISATLTGKHRKPHSEETKRKMSEAHKGKSRRPFSEEHKRKISEACKNYYKRRESK